MRTKILSAMLIAAVLAGAPVAALAANPNQCKDAKGKFIKCPPPPAPKAAPCRDAKGKFIACPPAKPAPCRDPKTKKFIKCK